MALPMRLVRTWRKRNGSPFSRYARFGGEMRPASSRPFSSACCANISSVSSTSSFRLKSTASSSMWPDSILEKSRMALMMPSNCRPELCTDTAKRRCSSVSLPYSSSSVMPSTPFMGVRISWLIVARNSLLARLDASLASRASLSSAVRTATSCSRCSRCATRRKSRSWICSSMPLKPRASVSSSLILEPGARNWRLASLETFSIRCVNCSSGRSAALLSLEEKRRATYNAENIAVNVINNWIVSCRYRDFKLTRR